MARPRNELVKVLPFTLIGLLFLYDNPNLPVIMYAIGLVLLFAALSHVVRKVTFFGLSLDRAYAKAMGTPLSASIVFAAMVYFLTSAFTAMVGFLR